MNATFYTMVALALLLGSAAEAKVDFTGTSYDVVIVRDGIPVDLLRCMTFHDGGRFSLEREPLSMEWTPMAHYPQLVLAVTSPSHRTVVPYHMAVFGELQANDILTGTGVYQDGSLFTFQGYPRSRCASEPEHVGVTSAARQPGIPKATSLNPQAVRIGDAMQTLMYRRYNPCWIPPGHYVPCDPPVDPLRSGEGPTERSRLSNSSFRLTVGTSEGKVNEHCWTFDSSRALDGADLHKATWRADPSDVSGGSFVAVGGGMSGQGIGYRGKLIGSNLLHVAGIESFGGEAIVTEGYGQRVRSCSER